MSEQEAPPPLPSERVKKPKTPMILGVILILFGLIGLLGGINGLISMDETAAMMEELGFRVPSDTISLIQGIVSICLSIWSAVVGVMLVRYKRKSREAYNIFAWVSIILGVVSAGYFLSGMPGGDLMEPNEEGIPLISIVVGAVIGALISILFYGLGLYFVNREKVKDYLALQ